MQLGRRPKFGAAGAEAATPADTTAELLPPLYARHLSDGRSDVQRPLPMPLQLAAVLLHEVTHGIVSRYTAQLLSSGDSEEARAANGLLQLTSESIFDARAVIEIFRRDGPAAAQALVNQLLPRRLNFADASHTTARALHETLAHVQRQPESVQSATQAFATALDVGRHSALQTWVEQVQTTANGHATPTINPLQTPEFHVRGRALDAALDQAKQAFGDGRFANSAFTQRGSHEAPSASDRHIFVAADATLSRAATLSAEGAHRLNALQTLMGNGGGNGSSNKKRHRKRRHGYARAR